MTSLPDVNLLLALVAAGHTHHAAAREWFESRDSAGLDGSTAGLLQRLTAR